MFRRKREAQDFDAEIEAHIELEAERLREQGLGEKDARAEARRAFGNVTTAREGFYEHGRWLWWDHLRQDLLHGARGLVRNRGFAVVAVLTLGLGIGANTAVFSVIDVVFLRPLPLREPERLVVLYGEMSAPGNYTDLTASNTVFEETAAMRPRDLSLTGDGEPERLSAWGMTANLLPMLGVQPALGRGVTADEDRAGGPHAVLLSHRLWQRRYGGAADVVGREIILDGEKYSVVGVMPAGFQVLDRDADAFVPMAFRPQDLTNRGSHYLRVFARLEPGVSPEQAQAETDAIMDRLVPPRPNMPMRPPHSVVPLREDLAGDARTPLLVLLVAVGLVLLIACINVGNLMLSRASARRREIAVRAALGASRGRVLRQLLTENVPLVVCGTAVGLAFAYWSIGFLRQLVPPGMRESAEITLEPRVLGFTLVVALVVTVLFGLVPALEASKVGLNDGLRQGGARSGLAAGGRLQNALVVGEVGLAIALLVGASLLIQTFFGLRAQFSDLRAESVLTMKTVLSRTAYDTHGKREVFFDRVLERVRALPGVVAAGYTNALPLDYKGDSTNVSVEGRALEPGAENEVTARLVTADYAKALGLAVRRGRYLTDADGRGSQPVANVNETFVRKFLPGEDALGKRFKAGDPDEDTPWMTIVGVVADVRQRGVGDPVVPEMYIPYAQADYMEAFAPKALAIRTMGDQAPVVAAVRDEVAAVDPNQPVSDVKTMNDVLGHELSARRLGTLLLGAFAAVALLLAAIGVFGLLAQRVAQMTPEIGVRLALGARPRDVVLMIVGRGMRLVLIGTAAGLALGFALSRLMSSMLFGVSAGDPLTFAAVPVVLAVVALAACYVPARRASRVDPNVVLRYE
jgi:predicted permease